MGAFFILCSFYSCLAYVVAVNVAAPIPAESPEKGRLGSGEIFNRFLYQN